MKGERTENAKSSARIQEPGEDGGTGTKVPHHTSRNKIGQTELKSPLLNDFREVA